MLRSVGERSYGFLEGERIQRDGGVLVPVLLCHTDIIHPQAHNGLKANGIVPIDKLTPRMI
jgi:hypothetical protein